MKKPSIESNTIEELWQGKSRELLKELHILTRDGKLNADSRRKLKQVYHLTQLVKPLIEAAYKRSDHPTVVDLGAGKSYLGFILYDLLMRDHEGGQVIGVEARPELVDRAQKLAQGSYFTRIKFIQSNIEDVDQSKGWDIQGNLDLVCALHACDTATDDAILLALRHGARALALVPCCQAEVARLLGELPRADQLSLKPQKVEEIPQRFQSFQSSHGSQSPQTSARLELHRGFAGTADWGAHTLWHHPIHRREFGSHLTNVIRCLYLESKGYRVRVTELVGWEHSLKNELIIAEKISDSYPPARARLEKLLASIPIRPRLLTEF